MRSGDSQKPRQTCCRSQRPARGRRSKPPTRAASRPVRSPSTASTPLAAQSRSSRGANAPTAHVRNLDGDEGHFQHRHAGRRGRSRRRAFHEVRLGRHKENRAMRRAQRASKKRAAKAALTPSLSCTYVALPAVLARVSIAEAHARAKVKSTLTAPTFLMCLRTTSSRSFALVLAYSA